METFWYALTEAQALLLSGFLTVFAAVVGVLIGWWFFRGEVNSLQKAVGDAKKIVENHKSEVESALANIRNGLENLDEQFVSALEGINQLRNGFVEAAEATNGAKETDNQTNTREELKNDWRAIQNQIEHIAASVSDGRTRAKYARIDRRRFGDLIEALDRDGQLQNTAQDYVAALDIWMKYKNGRKVPTASDCTAMAELKRKLAENESERTSRTAFELARHN
ncbi:hypothetical protein [Mesorhizobium sp. YR577]|uniref:hypothetical protein n=1 Tax=Mesorhizobium sp. YR577 TaxID=1884373 RepID=UPI0008E5A071|nr:hypothetical protein [Mesorhizobium sp. YR577]SFU21032.1 hypothetical protein SAMN05518861_12542 [Mesorhizobium sp. YR577]